MSSKMSSLASDVHNEYSKILYGPNNVKLADSKRKCNKCNKPMSRKTQTLINHANKCQGYIKYNSRGVLIKASNDPNSCNWINRTSSEATPTEEEQIISEMAHLNAQNEMRYDDNGKNKNKKRKFNELNERYENDENDAYSKGNILSYCTKAPPLQTKTEEHRSNEYFTEWFTVGGIPYDQMNHPLFIRAMKSLRPSYNPTCAKTATTTYVKILVDKDDALLRTELNGKLVQIMADGSDDGGKHPIMHLIAVCNIGTRLIAIIHYLPGTKMSATVIIGSIKDARIELRKNGIASLNH